MSQRHQIVVHPTTTNHNITNYLEIEALVEDPKVLVVRLTTELNRAVNGARPELVISPVDEVSIRFQRFKWNTSRNFNIKHETRYEVLFSIHSFTLTPSVNIPRE